MVDTTLPTISDFIPEIVCLGVDCLVCGILYSAYVFTNRAITSVSTAASFDLEKKVIYVKLFALCFIFMRCSFHYYTRTIEFYYSYNNNILLMHALTSGFISNVCDKTMYKVHYDLYVHSR